VRNAAPSLEGWTTVPQSKANIMRRTFRSSVPLLGQALTSLGVAVALLLAALAAAPQASATSEPRLTLISPVEVMENTVTIGYSLNRRAGHVAEQACSLLTPTTVTATSCGILLGATARESRYRATLTGVSSGVYAHRVKVTLTDGATATLLTPGFGVGCHRNVAPIALDDAYSVSGGTTLNVGAPGVLANDTDADGDQLTSTVVTLPLHGTLALHPDGSFSYTPPTAGGGGAGAGKVFTDSFTYQASDGQAVSTATVTITVGR
jgi:VCBS repeat-containing protein